MFNYIFWDTAIYFLLQSLQYIWVGCQVIEDEAQSGTGGVITTKNEKKGLGEDLSFSNSCRKNRIG